MEDHQHVCKFCYKTFPCGRSLGGHMRSHLINISSSNHPKSDHNANLPPSVFLEFQKKVKKISNKSTQEHCKECGRSFKSCKALFGHMKSHSVIQSCNSSSDDEAPIRRKKRSNLTKRHQNISPCASDIDHQDQQEVALSLILLSMDTIVDSSTCPFSQRKRVKTVSEVKSIENVSGFGSELDKPTKFRCVICKKGFTSYQALGGHRASHKKFRGGCAPILEERVETKKIKDHECPICCKVFQSGQALGGHKRSHLVAHQKRPPQMHGFLDLNLPAPVEDEYNPWWIASTLLSSSSS